eukprot:Opistho-2@95986
MAAAVATNPRGIPVAPFVADPNDFLKDGETVETLLEKFAERNQKYKFMETQLQMKKKSLKSKIPDITATLEMVRYLKQRCDAGETFKTDFELCDTVFAEATIAPTDKVCLWLGANVMLEYDVAEADGLLQKNLDTATRSLEQVVEDLHFLRDQITTMEVNWARVFNWDVKRRRKAEQQ